MKKEKIKNNGMDRRRFVEIAATTAFGFSIVPRHVIGGPGFFAPSDMITMAHIGCGTQGIREMIPLLTNPQIRITSVCDPNKTSFGYRDWSKDGMRMDVAKLLNKQDWMPAGGHSIPGGRDTAKDIIETFYGNQADGKKYKGCNVYEDPRELFAKEHDVDAVKIMTPDHLHGVLAMAAIKRGKHVLMHKPLSNRLREGKQVIAAANSSKSITHLIPWDSNGSMDTVMSWIKAGAIGNLKEVHNWTNRPVWPQYSEKPKDTPPIPEGFNWDLWLGPETERPYSPNYTNMVFRGWYDFGGGAMADMGHYSLWTVFNALKLTSPTIIIPNRSHVVAFNEPTPFRINNDFSFPLASTVRFKYPANSDRGPVDLCWYDGGMRPTIPEELLAQGKELPQEGMMFVGDAGKILTGFNIQNPKLISGNKALAPVASISASQSQVEQTTAALPLFVAACKGGKPYPGTFQEAEYLTEAVNLYAASLRVNKVLKYDASTVTVNDNVANTYLERKYRTGWALESI